LLCRGRGVPACCLRSRSIGLVGFLDKRSEVRDQMAKEVFQRTKPHVNVGTIGHIDPWQDDHNQRPSLLFRPLKVWRSSRAMLISRRVVERFVTKTKTVTDRGQSR